MAKPLMRDALDAVIKYTNAWKNEGRAAQEPHFRATKALKLDEIASLMAKEELPTSVPRTKGEVAVYDAWKKGGLPKPVVKARTERRINFSRPNEDVALLGAYLLDDEDAKPGKVGEAAFDRILEEARGNE